MGADPVSHPAGDTAGDDGALVARAQDGDAAAFDLLVRRHQQIVFAVAVRMLGDRDEAEDVAQDVFVRAYRAIGSFRREAKMSTWLVSIAMNLCRNRRRWWARRKRVIVASLDEPLETDEGAVGHAVADPAPGPRHRAESAEREQRIMAALQQLGEADRTMIVLRDLQGHSYEEIAKIAGCRLGTVKSRLSRARVQLRALLDGVL